MALITQIQGVYKQTVGNGMRVAFAFIRFQYPSFHFFYDVGSIWTHFIIFNRIGLEYTEMGSINIIIGLKTPEFFSVPQLVCNTPEIGKKVLINFTT